MKISGGFDDLLISVIPYNQQIKYRLTGIDVAAFSV